MPTLLEQFGNIDIYLFDQLLRGRISPDMRVLDAGCGHGRNLVYLIREGYEVFGVDSDTRAIAEVRRLASHLPPDHFRIERIEALSFPDATFDFVISSAVLHFAQNDEHFAAMIKAMWRVLRPGGLFFCRLASSIGIELQIRPLDEGRFVLPDGSTRYLVSEESLMRWTEEIGGRLLDPLKTTVVQNQRSMTTWVIQKPL